ncbi:hypothetical protein P692DRAFT_20904992, partial [Suillus brevipes Sb2]
MFHPWASPIFSMSLELIWPNFGFGGAFSRCLPLITTSTRPSEGCYVRSYGSICHFSWPRTSIFSMVLHAMVQIRELGTICHATWIHPNSLSQGHRDFVRPKKHLYSGDSVSLVGSTHRLNYSLYYELLCINLQFDL